jgi:hypothetical protein
MSTLDQLAWDIERDGIAAHEAAVRRMAETAQEWGIARVAAAVLGDQGAPDVVRERAFGIVAVRLARAGAARLTTAA